MRLPTRLLRRRLDSNKWDFGIVFILAGSGRFSGAAVLCSHAAMRSGAGLVTLGVPESLNSAVIKIKPREVMTLPLPENKDHTFGVSAYAKIMKFMKKADVIAMGPGLGSNEFTRSLVRKLVTSVNKPMVLDADALNALAARPAVLRAASRTNGNIVITPHPGEMQRLLGRGFSEPDRKKVAKKFSVDYNITVVLKGRFTQVADSLGNTYTNKTGNPGMATAGTGDVLAGIIAAFLGQGLAPFEAAKYAVYLHGVAGDLAAKEKTQIGMIASDIIDKLPEAIKKAS